MGTTEFIEMQALLALFYFGMYFAMPEEEEKKQNMVYIGIGVVMLVLTTILYFNE